MGPACPRCGAASLEPGARFCPSCGAALEGADGPRCGVHPGAEAEFACVRCGSFACAACRRSSPEGGALCAACAARLDAAAWHVPWEQRGGIL